MPQKISETFKMMMLQVVFGAVLLMAGLFLLTPGNVTQENIYIIAVAVAILYIKDGLILLANAGIHNMKMWLSSFTQKNSSEKS